jgi:uncharacterized coiled-coil protein SlyX
MTEIESRVLELELRFMTLERFARELSDVVAEQQKTIDSVTLEMRRLRDRLEAELESVGPPDKPPHY